MKDRRSWADAAASADQLRVAILTAIPNARIEFAGSLRREDPEVGDIDMLYEGELRDLATVPGVTWISGRSDRATLSWEGRQVDAWRVKPGTWGAALFAVTGPTHYFIWYARNAQRKGWRLSWQGLKDDSQADPLIAAATEEDIYRAFGKEWKHPKERGK